MADPDLNNEADFKAVLRAMDPEDVIDVAWEMRHAMIQLRARMEGEIGPLVRTLAKRFLPGEG